MEKNYLEVIASVDVPNEALGFVNTACTFRAVAKNELGDGLMQTHALQGVRFFRKGLGPAIGTIMPGSINQLATTNYKIGDRTVNKITIVAIGEEVPVQLANDRLKEQKACVILNGKPTVEFPKAAKKGAKVGEDVPENEEA